MSPDVPDSFGRSPAAEVRGALTLACLGSVIAWMLGLALARPMSPLGRLLENAGIPPVALPASGVAAAVLFSLVSYRRTVATRRTFRLTSEGFEINEPLGTYLLSWGNISEARETRGRALGIRVARREDVFSTHRGTPAQRQLLETTEPYGDWDFLFPQEDLGRTVGEVVAWIEARRSLESEQVQERKDGG